MRRRPIINSVSALRNRNALVSLVMLALRMGFVSEGTTESRWTQNYGFVTNWVAECAESPSWGGSCAQPTKRSEFRKSIVRSLFTRARALVPGLNQVNSVQAIQSCCFMIRDPSIYAWVFKVGFCHQVSPPDLFICFLRACSCASNLTRIDCITLPVATFK